MADPTRGAERVNDPEFGEGIGLINGERVPNPCWEAVRNIANRVLSKPVVNTGLILGVGVTGVAAGVLYNKGEWVLALTLASAFEIFALTKLNLDPQMQKVAVYIVASIIYELFLPAFTAANSNPTNAPLQYLPLIPVMLAAACSLHYFSNAVGTTYNQIKDRDSDIVEHPGGERFFGPFPMTSERLKYCAWKALPMAAGVACTVAASQTNGITQFLLESTGIQTMADAGMAVFKNLSDNALEARIRFERSQLIPYTFTTTSMMAVNTFLTEISKIAGPLSYSAAIITGKLPLFLTLTGLSEGWQRGAAQRLLETYGKEPPDFATDQQKTAIKVAAWVTFGLFGFALAGYTLGEAAKVQNSATWAATGTILGAFLGTFGVSLIRQRLWENSKASERGALQWFSRLTMLEYPADLAYWAGRLDHARNMSGATVPLIVFSLAITAGAAALDVARALDPSRIVLGPSTLAMIATTLEAVRVPGLFPLAAGNATLAGV